MFFSLNSSRRETHLATSSPVASSAFTAASSFRYSLNLLVMSKSMPRFVISAANASLAVARDLSVGLLSDNPWACSYMAGRNSLGIESNLFSATTSLTSRADAFVSILSLILSPASAAPPITEVRRRMSAKTSLLDCLRSSKLVHDRLVSPGFRPISTSMLCCHCWVQVSVVCSVACCASIFPAAPAPTLSRAFPIVVFASCLPNAFFAAPKNNSKPTRFPRASGIASAMPCSAREPSFLS